MAELVPVRNCDVQTRRGDVIFVHGLNGNPREYWCYEGKEENFWPRWLGEDLPQVGVWSLGYENAAFKARRLSLLSRSGYRGFAMPLTDRAENVLPRLGSQGIGERPVVFITHSMGGLLVKQLLRTARDSPDPKSRAILERTRGVCFLATPHIGSDLAKWATYFRTLLGTNVSLDELRPHEPLLRDLKKWYSNFVSRERSDIKTLSFYEMKPLPRVGLVVEPGDADPGVPLTGNYPLDEDHNSICKPTSKRSLVHTTTLDFIRACLGSDPAMESPDDWFLAHAYPMPPNFTGRLAEREILSEWLKKDGPHPLLVLRALGGFGKSALVWHWLLHDVDPASWPRVVWWNFYEGDASFENFLASTVQYLSVKQIKARALSAREQLETLFQELHQSGTLLVLDGFERALRAFGGLNAAYQGDDASGSEANERDCISPLVDLFLRNVAALPGICAKVLLTTRLRPRAVEAKGGGLLQGVREEELTQMDPADAVAFFRVQGIRGTHTEIEQACQPYGYHPLSLCLLAGLIVGNFQQPGDIAAAQRLNVSGDLVQRRHHVLEAAYDSLTPPRQALLGRIACFRSPMSFDALKALVDSPKSKSRSTAAKKPRTGRSARLVGLVPATTLDTDLRDLLGRGLLHHDTKEGRFDLHPIVRRYAYDRLTAPDRAAAHTRLRDYFAAVPEPERVTRLEDLAPVIELYHHTVRAGQYDEARKLFRDRIDKATYYQLGAYQLQIDLLRALFPDGEDRLPRLKDETAQAVTLSDLACNYGLNGQPRRAVPLYEQGLAIVEKLGDKENLATCLGAVASVAFLPMGMLRAAEANHRRRIALCREIENEFEEAVGHEDLGRLHAYRGGWADSKAELATALTMHEEQAAVQSQGVVWAYRALRALLAIRSQSDSSRVTRDLPLKAARRSLELADEIAHTFYPNERDYVRAHWLLGVASRIAGEHDEAERHLHEALKRCRRTNTVEAEADILIDLARLRSATGATDEAARLAEEALVITERSGYVLQGADAHLELAKLALARGDKTTGRQHATEARRLATCDGPPDYTYKVAYDEAGDLLDQLK